MRRRSLALSFSALVAAALMGPAAEGAPRLSGPAKIFSLVEGADCRGPGMFCPTGLRWGCGGNRCGCAPCAYSRPRPALSRATATHFVVLVDVGHCAVADSKPSAGSSLKIVGEQRGYASLDSANEALKDSIAECRDLGGAGTDAKFKAAQAKAEKSGVQTLTRQDIEGLSLDQIRQLRGY
jgi:hypothetical protein